MQNKRIFYKAKGVLLFLSMGIVSHFLKITMIFSTTSSASILAINEGLNVNGVPLKSVIS